MTLEEAKRFFMEQAYLEPLPAEREAVRGTFDPMYLNYTLGKLQIIKLRDDYKARTGDGFSLKGFHDKLLSFGAPPIPLVREAMLGELSGPSSRDGSSGRTVKLTPLWPLNTIRSLLAWETERCATCPPTARN